jgi:hypothetical protein
MPDAKATVEIPRDVYERVQQRLKGSAFGSVDDFVGFVLARLTEGNARAGEPLSPQDEARVRERLRSLGYID